MNCSFLLGLYGVSVRLVFGPLKFSFLERVGVGEAYFSPMFGFRARSFSLPFDFVANVNSEGFMRHVHRNRMGRVIVI
jgi:hypothetical protein